ncbi:MAG: hypothetical protein IJC83_03595 [Oscillospiraceae bacterium]|nr:hypothetical protein [Oscillospiraceae bacterium]
MAKQKLTYRFHNPNSVESTAEHLLKVLIEANAKKVETEISKASEEVLTSVDETNTYNEHSA